MSIINRSEDLKYVSTEQGFYDEPSIMKVINVLRSHDFEISRTEAIYLWERVSHQRSSRFLVATGYSDDSVWNMLNQVAVFEGVEPNENTPVQVTKK